MGIGGNHFLHGARRNIDLTVIMLDNGIYGMTGGQVAPTTPTDAKTQTSPYGNPEPPIDSCAVAISCGATYVARWTSAHPIGLQKAIKEAIQHKGFSFIQAVSQCPTQAGRYIYGTGKPVDLFRLIKENSVSLAKAEKMSPEALKDKILVGKLYQDEAKPELSEKIYGMMTE
jgi:2-oxoglutarate ferredoxin oxidoreductase subunit beta